ncbi:MAG: M23 family metallopeptidase [Ignavibacteriae bacterium]|nr:M23 family metallopeptidase [Ignavibacteriota bacterium]
MKKNIYYFSEKKLKYAEIKNFYSKFISIVAIFSLVIAFILFGGYNLITKIFSPNEQELFLSQDNELIKEKFVEMSEKVALLNKEIEILKSTNNDLRLTVNLDPLTKEDRNLGIGGSIFNRVIPTEVSSIKDLVEKVDQSLDVLTSKISFEKNNYSEIETSLNHNKELFKSIPAILPTNGPLGDKFGMRLHPILRHRRMHTGLDVVVNTGTKVYAPGNGTIKKVGYRSGYGKVIEIDHGFGYTSLYAHLSKISVKRGKKIMRGDLLGLSGQTGSMATGPHLHYEVKHKGIALNPRNFIFNDIKLFDFISDENLSTEKF